MNNRPPRAAGLPRCARLGALVAALAGGLCPAAAGRADVLRILNSDQEAAQARVDLIEQAQVQIDAAYFSVGDDHLALGLLALLRDASRRGVRVRLIVDALNNDIPNGVQEHLLAAGVEIREYHPVDVCRPLEINRRMHDKVLLVDSCQLIVGGRNLDYRNFGLAKRNFEDCDAYVRGEVARKACRYFECLWRSDEVAPTDTADRCWPESIDDHPMCHVSRQLKCGAICPCAALNQSLCKLQAMGFVQTGTGIDWAAGLPELECVRFLHDRCGEKREAGAISGQLVQMCANARDSIILESPYLVVSRHLDEAIAQAQRRGVHVVILTNSLASTDQTLVYAGYSNQKKRLLARGVELWEFAGPDHFHAKTALIDGCISVIGSYNFDPRSEHLNTETAVVACDPNVTDDLINTMTEHFGNAWRIGRDGKPIDSNERHPGAEPGRVLELLGARAVATLIKRHL